MDPQENPQQLMRSPSPIMDPQENPQQQRQSSPMDPQENPQQQRRPPPMDTQENPQQQRRPPPTDTQENPQQQRRPPPTDPRENPQQLRRPPPSLPQQSPPQSQSPSPAPSNHGSDLYSFLLFLICLGSLLVAMSSSGTNISNMISILHQVPEGHVGVYWRGGALLKEITDPGFHLKMPFITHFEHIQVTLQTDKVKDIPCGTKGGVMISFEKVEVVNRLRKDYVYETLLNYGVTYDKTWIYDKIHHEINQFCSGHTLQQVYIDMFDQIDDKMKDALQGDCTRYAPGVEILSVRVTKPTIPPSIQRNFEEMEEERTKKMEKVFVMAGNELDPLSFPKKRIYVLLFVSMHIHIQKPWSSKKNMSDIFSYG